jgi:death-on-curing family protein
MKIILKIIDYKTNDPMEMFTNTHKNKLLFYNDKNSKFYINSRYSGVTEIEVYYSIIELDKEFSNYLNNFIKPAIKDAHTLSEEPISAKIDTIKIIEDAIQNTINFFCYNDNPCIFEFLRDIFIKLLKFHPFINGNKRFATAFLFTILRSFGFHFSWSKGLEKNYEKHQDTISNFVSELSINKKEQEIKILHWIKSNCVIAIPN